MMPGETILSGAHATCCGEVLLFQVLKSPAGWYVGTSCPQCGPYSRETVYIYSEREAKAVQNSFERLQYNNAMEEDLMIIDHYGRGK